MKRLLFTFIGLLIAFTCVMAQVEMPCRGTATTVLNVRSGPGTQYYRIGQLRNGETVNVIKKSNENWVQIEFRNQKGYAHADYLKFSPAPQSPPSSPDNKQTKQSNWSFWSIVGNIIVWGFMIYLGLGILHLSYKLLLSAFFISSWLLTLIFKIVSIPFFWLNSLQRYMAKPWFVFFKYNRFSNQQNENLRTFFSYLKIPFYILLTPVRLFNSIFFNLIIHCSFELFNYIMEVVFPSCEKEGEDSYVRWTLLLPFRILKYVVWHGSLTIIESCIWTVTEVFLPTLTLFHGTSYEAADNIVASPNRGLYRGYNTGIWHVGDGNFAGNGIYFAPARSTAEYYSGHQAIIICRVTLGKTLDLGMAPKHVYNKCGYADALEATDWGLKNGYITGEWWRSDREWWEYCMYDWQNRYNYSWRIRPLYVIRLDTGHIQRIPGGMCHWLFRRLVINDILATIFK